MKINIVYIIPLFFASGCAGKWVKNGYSDTPFHIADQTCTDEAKREYPVRNEVAQRTAYGSHVENCKKKEDCGGKGYKVNQVPLIESYVMDVNLDSREDLYRSCMKGKGWEKVSPFF